MDSIDAWMGLSGPHHFIDSHPDAAIIVKSDGTIFYANSSVSRLFGWGRPEIVGKPVEKLIPLDRHERHAGHLAAWFRNPRTRRMGESIALPIEGLNKFGDAFPAIIELQILETQIGVMALAWIRRRENDVAD